mgnify:CR=1 FL=1
MEIYQAGNYDVAVIGGGHAGIEAALAAARLGMKTILFTINLDAIGNMPCNPSIGGSAKGHLVREIDALGGEMAKAADKVFLQSRMLNKGKGPAVHSLRIQADRRKYQEIMKQTLEQQSGLDIKQGEIVCLDIKENAVCGVVTKLGALYAAKAVIIASGTYLEGKIFVGSVSYSGGPDGMFAAEGLSDNLRQNGINLQRFKTGTPARIHKKSVNLSKLEVQHGDEEIVPMSFENEYIGKNTKDCYIVYTNEKTHNVIRQNLHRSPLYSGNIHGIGPRYCPSIEDKVVRFSDKARHQLFLEPVGADTEEMYLGGMSSSLPEDVQIEMIHTLPGFENAKIMRTAYAIEYDCIDPTELYATLEFKKIKKLFGAGQFNGTSGYEEAAAQGLVAGINAARCVQGKEPIIFARTDSYIGTLIDDLVTKGTNEPYRMMTSRSEYRLILRQDNADLRLTPLGYQIGLIRAERYQKFEEKWKKIEAEIKRCEKTFLPPNTQLQQLLEKKHSSSLVTGVSIADLLRRPEISYKDLSEVDIDRPSLNKQICEEVEISIKYEGYIKRQKSQAEQMKKMEAKRLPHDIDYTQIRGLRIEAAQKLNRHRPLNIGQAARISGVNPADVSILLIYFDMI